MIKQNEPKSIAGYIRVSTQEQARKGISLEAQEEAIKEYCERNHLRLYKIYIDRGVTARKKLYRRQGFMEMMEDVDAGRVNHILVIRLDRFFRNIYDYHKMMKEHLEPHKCDWSAIFEDYDTTTTNGRLMINLRLAIAEQECDQDSDRIKDVHNHLIAEGRLPHGNTPFGYSNVNHRAVPNEDAEKVKYFFEKLLFTRSIISAIQAVNVKYGTKFVYKKGKDILANEMYIGVYRDNQNFCEPIIDRKTWDEAQNIGRHTIKNAPRNTFIFSGLVRCEICGRSMTGDEYKGYKYYRCPNTSGLCTNNRRIRETLIEDYLVENTIPLFREAKLKAEAREKSKPKVVSNEEQIRAKISRLNDLFIDGLITMDELKKKKAVLESQIVKDEPSEQKNRLEDVEAVLNGGFLSVYKDLTEKERQFLWHQVIREIRENNALVDGIVFL